MYRCLSTKIKNEVDTRNTIKLQGIYVYYIEWKEQDTWYARKKCNLGLFISLIISLAHIFQESDGYIKIYKNATKHFLCNRLYITFETIWELRQIKSHNLNSMKKSAKERKDRPHAHYCKELHTSNAGFIFYPLSVYMSIDYLLNYS